MTQVFQTIDTELSQPGLDGPLENVPDVHLGDPDVAVLIALNFFFHLHISIIGSLVLTVVLNLVMRMFQSKS